MSIEADSRQQLLAEAREIRQADDLGYPAGIAHENPYVVANTLAKLRPPLVADRIAEVKELLGAKSTEVRSTAATLLYLTVSAESTAALAAAIDDANPVIRALAAIALAKSEEELPVARLAEIFEARSIGNPLWGAESNYGISPNAETVHNALATRGDRIDAEVFELLLRYPPRMVNHNHEKETFPKLGAAVAANPDLARILLSADDTRDAGGVTNRDFARDVFRFTGGEVLPILHETLKSDDRILRANAALGCGANGSPESIEPLLAALDLESGLSKGAIVWALGELEARESIPRITGLYLEAQAAEKRRYSSGVQFAQAAAAVQQEQSASAAAENLRADWDELKAAAERANAPANPLHDEPLLTPRMVLEALRKIGPEHAQPFYRGLAATGEDSTGRIEAGQMLLHAPEDEREPSLSVLRMLAADAEAPWVQVAAGVSLLLLGENRTAEPAILNALESSSKGAALSELRRRVDDKSRLGFAKEALQEIASDSQTPSQIREIARGLVDEF